MKQYTMSCSLFYSSKHAYMLIEQKTTKKFLKCFDHSIEIFPCTCTCIYCSSQWGLNATYVQCIDRYAEAISSNGYTLIEYEISFISSCSLYPIIKWVTCNKNTNKRNEDIRRDCCWKQKQQGRDEIEHSYTCTYRLLIHETIKEPQLPKTQTWPRC